MKVSSRAESATVLRAGSKVQGREIVGVTSVAMFPVITHSGSLSGQFLHLRLSLPLTALTSLCKQAPGSVWRKIPMILESYQMSEEQM